MAESTPAAVCQTTKSSPRRGRFWSGSAVRFVLGRLIAELGSGQQWLVSPQRIGLPARHPLPFCTTVKKGELKQDLYLNWQKRWLGNAAGAIGELE